MLIYSIKIFDAYGNLIYNLKQESNKIDADWSICSNEIYLVNIYDENGFAAKKVIKQ